MRLGGLVVAYGLLLVAWVFANPPSAAPDEPALYIKALAAGGGELVGRPPDKPPPGLTPFDVHLARVVRVSGRLLSAAYGCTAFHPELSARCLRQVPVGRTRKNADALSTLATYQPFVYVLPGLIMRAGHGPDAALRLGRACLALLSLALLAAATALLAARQDQRESPLAPLPALVALTPMVIFVASTLSASSVEVAAGCAFSAAMLRLDRDGSAHGPALWATLALSGSVLALSRPLGPLWVVLILAVALVLVGARGARDLVRDRRAMAAGCAIAGSVLVSVAWQLLVQPHAALSLRTAASGAVRGFEQLPSVIEQSIGVFGWQDTRMTAPAYSVWAAMVVSVIVLAFLVGSRRQRRALGGAMVALVIAVPMLDALVILPVGGGDFQARWILPFGLMIPLLSGHIVASNWKLLRLKHPRRLLAGVASVAAAVQFAAFYANARRYAVGIHGPHWFLGTSQWNPPLGWEIWLTVALIGAVGILISQLDGRFPAGSRLLRLTRPR